MPHGNPLEALKNAQRIGPETYGVGPDTQVTRGEMPLAPFSGMALKGLTSAADLLKPTAKAIGDKMYKQANPLFKKLEATGMFGGDRLNRIPAQVVPSAEYVPVGGEGAFNALRQAPRTAVDALEQAYRRILSNRGR